jgi:hypothetical protein
MSAASTSPETAQESCTRLSGHDCPECLKRFPLRHPRQIFCSKEHKRDWEGRTRRRGFEFLPFAIPARTTRGGTRGDTETGSRANRDADFLIDKWRDEDTRAGRMSASDYLKLRYRLGFWRR